MRRFSLHFIFQRFFTRLLTMLWSTSSKLKTISGNLIDSKQKYSVKISFPDCTVHVLMGSCISPNLYRWLKKLWLGTSQNGLKYMYRLNHHVQYSSQNIFERISCLRFLFIKVIPGDLYTKSKNNHLLVVAFDVFYTTTPLTGAPPPVRTPSGAGRTRPSHVGLSSSF